MEIGSDGLLLSFTGKLPGLAVRLSLMLAYLEWAVDGGEEPMEITAEIFDRAAHFVEYYAVPMARRAYVDASHSKSDCAARRLIATIRENSWERFTTRDVLRLGRAGISTAPELNPAIVSLEHADIINGIEVKSNPKDGRPNRLYAVNPMVRIAPA